MPTINVTIDDKTYKMACKAGQEDYLRNLVARFEKYILHLKSNFGAIGDHRLSVMAGIMVLDEMSEMQKQLQALQVDMHVLYKRYQEAKTAEKILQAQSQQVFSIETPLVENLERAAEKIEDLAQQLKSLQP